MAGKKRSTNAYEGIYFPSCAAKKGFCVWQRKAKKKHTLRLIYIRIYIYVYIYI